MAKTTRWTKGKPLGYSVHCSTVQYMYMYMYTYIYASTCFGSGFDGALRVTDLHVALSCDVPLPCLVLPWVGGCAGTPCAMQYHVERGWVVPAYIWGLGGSFVGGEEGG